MVKYLRALFTVSILLLIIVGFIIYITYFSPKKKFYISIAHISDFDSQYDGTLLGGEQCKDVQVCIGGFEKLYTMIDQLQMADNFILLNSGGNLLGSRWYSYFKWNVSSLFLNLLDFDAVGLGSHDLDGGVEHLVNYFEHMASPIVACNIDDRNQPQIQGKYKKSIVINRSGKKIGIIGAIFSGAAGITRSENMIFLDEVTSINAEAEKLVENGVFTNIVLTHSGYEKELKMAEQMGPKVTVIVGGQGRVFLYNGHPPSNENQTGPYPTVVRQSNDWKVLYVRSDFGAKYIGNITVAYDEDGDVLKWEGNPIYLGENASAGQFIQRYMRPFRKRVEEFSQVPIGEAKTHLYNDKCYLEECPIGNFFADAMVFAWQPPNMPKEALNATIALLNPGAIRAPIQMGHISYNNMITTHPFNHHINCIEIEGKYIKQALEDGTTPLVSHQRRIFQVSGVKMVIDMKKDFGSRVQSVKVLCQDCEVPIYEELSMDKTYRLILPDYLAEGKDKFDYFRTQRKLLQHGLGDVDIFTKYLTLYSPIAPKVEGRIVLYE